MDSLKHELLLRQLADFGYPLISTTESDGKTVLLQMAASDESRIVEGFPIVLVNLLRRKQISLADIESIYKTIITLTVKKKFLWLCGITCELLRYIPEEPEIRKLLARFVGSHDSSLITRIHANFVDGAQINLGGMRVDSTRIETTFRNYVVSSLSQQKRSVEESLHEKRLRALNESLSTLFSDRQREIVLKLLNDQKLDKTEREYYSRVIKKRLRAIANDDLQSIAQSLLK
ncbi:MAG TPA: hypothetical protein V6C81_08765 [Planktothrix sp.]|jgi:hypothetical protein